MRRGGQKEETSREGDEERRTGLQEDQERGKEKTRGVEEMRRP